MNALDPSESKAVRHGVRPRVEVLEIDAFSRIYDAYAPVVFRAARGLGVPTHELEDVIQEVFLVIYHQLCEGLSIEKNLQAWILGVAWRTVRCQRRKSRRRAELVPVVGVEVTEVASREASPEEQNEHVEAWRILESVLASMSADRRLAFILVELEQLTVRQAADLVGVRQAAMASRVRAARDELTTLFQKRVVYERRRLT